MSNITYTGVDLSQWNGTVDFKKLKAGGYNFVILRAGYGRVASQKDTRFEEYYKKATEAGLEVGCYWFSYANTPDDGIAEANAFLSVIKGKKFSFPCYYDVEDPKTSLANGVSRATLTNMVNNWCKTVEAAGYKAGVYTFYAAINRFNMAEIPYEKWLAKWSTSMGNCSPNEWGCWQYAVIGNTSECTRSGKIPGCDQCGAVDADYSFKDYPKIIGISFADPNYKPVKPEKSVEEVAKEVWEGKWGNGEERRRRLTEAGYDYDEVQREVERIASNYQPTPEPAKNGIYSKTCWTGDSRTVQLNIATGTEIVASKGGESINYFNNHYSEAVSKVGYNIVCWYGINGANADHAKKCATAYNKLANDLKGKSQVFVATIGHCPNGTGSGKVDGGAGQSIEWQNNGVITFNSTLLQNISKDIIVIDLYTYIKKLEDELGAYRMTADNLHYRTEVSQKINEYVNTFISKCANNQPTDPVVIPEEPKKKSVEEIAKEVWEGKWGNGEDRKKRLTEAGYDYNEVQREVERLASTYSNNSKPSKKSVEEIAKEVWEGKWGNGAERKQRLTEAEYNYDEVQREVEKLASTYSNGSGSAITAGKKIKFNNVNLYGAATSNAPSRVITGNYFIYSDEVVKGRIRITNSINYVGKTPSGKYVTGWVNVSDIK